MARLSLCIDGPRRLSCSTPRSSAPFSITPSRAWFGLCGPYTGEDLVWHPVTPDMGSPKVQGPDCCAPLKRMTVDQFFGTAKKRRQEVAPKQEKELEQGHDLPKNARATKQEDEAIEVKLEPAPQDVKEEHGTPTPKRKQQRAESSPQPTPDPKQPSLFKFMSPVKKKTGRGA